ncbi:PIN domain-containing protein [Lentisphaera marina]|uniref:type II toxin-antitoxin system VapC family toxin n=1 Tax=Lentisphaera marina TaxID=1111041 RepID=UPI002365C031|nr:PIN domain-containing protein [Lentisphaera marina]MDD7986624.1 PIN domain-containing protein [Lentisphaera marina]
MKVIVDTSIWSLAFRRKQPDQKINQSLSELIQDQRLIMIGPIKQEVLSGYSDIKKFNLLKEKLSFFPNELIIDEDYEKAANFHNLCRAKGIQGSHIDYLICSVSYRLNAMIYTTDKDFIHYQKVLPIQLFEE